MFEEQVQNGAKFLDMARNGWENEINLDILQLSSCYQCVCGQLFGGEKTARSVEMHRSGMVFLGFALNEIFNRGESFKQYGLLTTAWKAEITRRRKLSAIMANIAENNEPITA